MATSVLEGFLVRLGFDVNKEQLSKFNNVVDTAKKRVTQIATAGAAVASAFALATNEAGKLYFQVRTAGSSVKGIKTLSGAIEAVGGSSEAAGSAINNLANNLRTIPNYSSYLKRFGVNVFDKAGVTRDTVDILVDLRKQFLRMDRARAKAYADSMGLGGIFNDLMKPEFITELERSRSLIGELSEGMNSASKSSAALSAEISASWDILSTGVQSFTAQFTQALGLDKKLASFNDSFAKHFTAIIESELEMIKASSGFFDWLFTRLFNDDKYQDKVFAKQGITLKHDKTPIVNEDGEEISEDELEKRANSAKTKPAKVLEKYSEPNAKPVSAPAPTYFEHDANARQMSLVRSVDNSVKNTTTHNNGVNVEQTFVINGAGSPEEFKRIARDEILPETRNTMNLVY